MSKSVLPVSVIVTVLNEAGTVDALLQSLVAQTYRPSEIIIIDGGSDDETVKRAADFAKRHPQHTIIVKQKKGNRSVGRNYAIELSTTEHLACTDAGCLPRADWLQELVKTYLESGKPVIAGFYAGMTTSDFQRAVVPYVLVMPDKVDPESFLPATRSLFMEKKVWQQLGGFDENLSDNEDYEFAHRLKQQAIPIAFAQNAVVAWQPRQTLQQFYRMIYRFARGDVQARLIRPKVLLLFARYIFVIFLFVMITASFSLELALKTTLVLFIMYCVWSIQKNAAYAGRAWYWLPILQLSSDLAVLLGSGEGLLMAMQKRKR